MMPVERSSAILNYFIIECDFTVLLTIVLRMSMKGLK